MEEKKISLKLAKELSLLKWNYILEHESDYISCEDFVLGGYTKNIAEELKYNHFSCGFCMRHEFKGSYDQEPCEDCELGKIAGMCCDDDSLYSRIDSEDEGDIKEDLIKEMIEIIENIEVNED